VDEVRVASVARSAGWIETAFRNQNAPSSFYNVGAEQAAPFAAQWRYGFRKKLTIDNTRVTCGSDVSDFPVLISLVDPDLRTVADGGNVEHPNGYDITFRDSTGQGTLDSDVEAYTSDGVNGTLVAWVRVPTVAASAPDTDIFMYYGNPAVSCPVNTQNPPGVWDTNYRGVWHLREDPTGATPQVLDSTSNWNHGTSNGTMTVADQVAGQINGSLDFDGTDDYLDAGTDASLDMGAGDLTLEAWFNTTGVVAQRVVGKGSSGTAAKRYVLSLDTTDCGVGPIKGELDDDTTKQFICSAATYNDGTWHYAAVVRDGTNLRLYLDGTEDPGSPIDITGYGNIDSLRPFFIGALWAEGASGPNSHLTGGIDEVRVSDTARTACWIETEHNNQSIPTKDALCTNNGFVCVGAEEVDPPTAVELASFRARGGDGEVLLEWETGSEIENLGFHLYRSASEEGSYVRITSSLIPGLGSSPAGAKYSYHDSGLTNGVTYYYKLEDIETTGKTELHGPVSATPEAGLPAGDNQDGEEGSEENSGDSTARIVFGDPGAPSGSSRSGDRAFDGRLLRVSGGRRDGASGGSRLCGRRSIGRA
jgi:hypothetical protein